MTWQIHSATKPPGQTIMILAITVMPGVVFPTSDSRPVSTAGVRGYSCQPRRNSDCSGASLDTEMICLRFALRLCEV